MRAIRRIITISLVAGLGLAAVGLGLAGAGMIGQGADEDRILFEPAMSLGPDPFTPPATQASGPFGGTGSDERCDPELLISFLLENRDRLSAWAGVQGIEPDEVADYIRSLRPVLLTEDTPVTNHGFRNGRAYAFQSMLAAGTAVLVDEDGKIVVRCRCGNPLDIPDCPDCEPGDDCPDGEKCDPPDEECPEYSSSAADACDPPDEECPEYSSSAADACDPPDEECPEYSTHSRPGECDPPTEEECPRSHILALDCDDEPQGDRDQNEDEGPENDEGPDASDPTHPIDPTDPTPDPSPPAAFLAG